MSESNLDFTFIPSLSCGLITGNGQLLKNGKSSCLLGVDARGFITFTTENEKTSQEIEALFVSGKTAFFQSGLKDKDYSYRVTDPINTLSTNLNDMTFLNKLTYRVNTKDGICRGLDNCEVGYNQNIQMSKCGHLNGGWYHCDPRDYISYGFEGFANPFIWNKRTIGTSGDFTYKNCKFYTHYGVRSQSAAVAGYPTSAGTGFLSPDVPSICDFSICYGSQNEKCPYDCTFNIQRINEGTKSNNNWSNGFNQTLEEGSATAAAINGLKVHLNKSQYTNACTGILSTKPMKNTEINGYCTLANFDTNDTDNARISKWAIGCFIRSLFKGFCKKNPCVSEFAINVGTPAYLSKGYVNSNISQNADSVPVVCELDYTLIMGGFNIPMFFSLYNNVNGKSSEDLSASYEGSRLCICGIRPNRIITTGSSAKTKTILPCLPEGGIHDQSENE